MIRPPTRHRPPPPIDNHPEPESASSGLTALYQALTRQLANAQPESPASPDGDTEDARGFLKLLVERNQLELESGKGVDDLVLGTTAIMASTLSHDDKAQKLSAWLFTQEAVAELYAADDDLAMLLSQW